ncbi:hypothetical protein [Nocardia sp. NPDC050413]|uniref:hypothetical protein n=1 Tax=Nocardia sp. NPDC050413 TaxID=3155784 RepID=UPI0033EE4725
MTSNNIRPAAAGFVVGAASLLTVIAVLESDAVHRVEQWQRRLRMDPAERAEFDALAEQIRLDRDQHLAEAEARKARIRAKFRPDQVVTVTDREITDLSEFTVAELIGEITECKRRIRQTRQTRTTLPSTADLDQLAALIAEFDARHWDQHQKQTRLDRQRLDGASRQVHDGSEWMPQPAEL